MKPVITPIQQDIIKAIFQSDLGIFATANLPLTVKQEIDRMDALKLIFKQGIQTHNGIVDVATLRHRGLEAYQAMEG